MTQREAAEGVVQTLRDLGRVEATHEALLAAYVRLAAEIDDTETKDRAGLFREFRNYDSTVRALGGSDDDGSSLDELLESLAAAEVGHKPAPRPSDQG